MFRPHCIFCTVFTLVMMMAMAMAKARAQDLPDGGHEEATSALLQRWAARLSVALHRSNAARLRSDLGEDELAKIRGEDLAAELAK